MIHVALTGPTGGRRFFSSWPTACLHGEVSSTSPVEFRSTPNRNCKTTSPSFSCMGASLKPPAAARPLRPLQRPVTRSSGRCGAFSPALTRVGDRRVPTRAMRRRRHHHTKPQPQAPARGAPARGARLPARGVGVRTRAFAIPSFPPRIRFPCYGGWQGSTSLRTLMPPVVQPPTHLPSRAASCSAPPRVIDGRLTAPHIPVYDVAPQLRCFYLDVPRDGDSRGAPPLGGSAV